MTGWPISTAALIDADMTAVADMLAVQEVGAR